MTTSTNRLRSILCLLFAMFALSSVARAVTTTVNYGGTDYDITYYLGTFNNQPSGVNLSAQPWFGNQTTAYNFAQLVAGSLGFENFGSQSPYFVYSVGNGGTTWAGAYYDNGGYVTAHTSVPTEGWLGRFAYVTQSAPVATPDSGTSLVLALIGFGAVAIARRRITSRA